MRWDLGIDLGTAFVRVTDGRADVLLNEPSLLALRGDNTPAYVGESAWRLMGRTPRNLNVVSPMKDGVPESTLYTTLLFEWLFRRDGESRRRRRAVLVSCSPDARPVYRDALMQSCLDAGASDVALVRSDAASALGSGVDLMGPQATFVVDVGAGKMTATLFSLGREVASGYLPYGMDRITERIMARLRSDYGFSVGWHTAEDIKLSLATAHPGDGKSIKVNAAGLSLTNRLPSLAEISPELIMKICEDPLRELMSVCQSVISGAPEELSADLNDVGATLTGGGAAIPGLDKLIGDVLGIPCTIAESPALSGIKGINAMMLESDRYAPLIMQRMAVAQRR